MSERYDTLVLGGGMAGLPLALRAARRGRVAFVEKELLGGTCLNRGCIPTKTMIASAAVAHQTRRAHDYGVRITGLVSVDLAAVVARKNTLVDSIRTGAYRTVEKSSGIDFFHAPGHFTAPCRLSVDGTDLTADRIILAPGTRTALPAIDGLDSVPYYTSRTLLDLTDLPTHLLVVGGGYVGCEFAQMFRRFGAEVTLVQRPDRLLPGEDPDISAAVTDGMTADGITVLTGTTCTHATGTTGDIRLGCTGAENTEVTGSHLLVATGRTPNTDALGLEHLGLQPAALTLSTTIGDRPENTTPTPTPTSSIGISCRHHLTRTTGSGPEPLFRQSLTALPRWKCDDSFTSGWYKNLATQLRKSRRRSMSCR